MTTKCILPYVDLNQEYFDPHPSNAPTRPPPPIKNITDIQRRRWHHQETRQGLESVPFG